MTVPGFTAEASLYAPSGHYQTDRHAIKSSRQMIRSVYAAATRGEEVINVHSCAPGFIEVGSGEDAFCTPGPGLWWNGMGGVNWPPDLPPGGGGGGGGTPTSVPADIVADCVEVGGKFGEKYCGGPAGPSSCKMCAQIVCQQEKCKETKRCDPTQLNGTKETKCNVGCPDVPGLCKDGLTTKSSVLTRGLRGVFLRI